MHVGPLAPAAVELSILAGNRAGRLFPLHNTDELRHVPSKNSNPLIWLVIRINANVPYNSRGSLSPSIILTGYVTITSDTSDGLICLTIGSFADVPPVGCSEDSSPSIICLGYGMKHPTVHKIHTCLTISSSNRDGHGSGLRRSDDAEGWIRN
jgi:hypothetical protein